MKLVTAISLISSSLSFSFIANYHRTPSKTQLYAEKVGIFFGTSTGSTGEAAELICDELRTALSDDSIPDPIDVDALSGEEFLEKVKEFNSLVVGTPTWNTGADTERSGTGWDELYYSHSMQSLDLSSKKVAVFGLGDSVSYTENYADATGELHDVFQKLGCNMIGYVSQEGYLHEASKSIRGDLFCGLLLDAVNQEDLTEERVKNWVQQIIGEGLLSNEEGNEVFLAKSEESKILSEEVTPEVLEEEEPQTVPAFVAPVPSIESISGGYKSYYNKKTKKTMWVSADGRSCYYSS